MDFLLNRVTGGEVPTEVEKKIEAFRAIIPTFEAVPHAHLQAEYLERIARSLAVNPDILRDVLRSHRRGIRETADMSNIKFRIEGEGKVEREFIAGLLKHPGFMAETRTGIEPGDFTDPLHAEVFAIIIKPSFPLSTKGLTLQPDIYENQKVYSFIVDCAFSDTEREITEKDMRFLLFNMIERKIKGENRIIEQHLQDGDEGNTDLQVKLISNYEKLKKLKTKLLG